MCQEGDPYHSEGDEAFDAYFFYFIFHENILLKFSFGNLDNTSSLVALRYP